MNTRFGEEGRGSLWSAMGEILGTIENVEQMYDSTGVS
jgi:hypothetical protein